MTATISLTTPLGRLFAAVKGREMLILGLGVGIQFVVLGAMLVKHYVILAGSATYDVRVAPVDPRDLLRGDYVILDYDFNRLPIVNEIRGTNPGQDFTALERRPIYVTLVKDGRFYRGGQFSTTPPPDGQPYLQGRVEGWGRVEYPGIQSYFVQEGKGHAYEDAARSGRLSAKIAVNAEGEARLVGLQIDGEAWNR